MLEILRDLTNELYRINEFIGKTVFSSKEIIEEENNLKKLSEIQVRLKKQLQKIKACPLDDEKQFCSEIIQLHVLTSNLSWYFENLSKNVEKIIQKYPFSPDFLEKTNNQ